MIHETWVFPTSRVFQIFQTHYHGFCIICVVLIKFHPVSYPMIRPSVYPPETGDLWDPVARLHFQAGGLICSKLFIFILVTWVYINISFYICLLFDLCHVMFIRLYILYIYIYIRVI